MRLSLKTKVCFDKNLPGYNNFFATKIVKFLNQCFAQLWYPKSVCIADTVGFVNSRHFSDIEVVQNTDLRI